MPLRNRTLLALTLIIVFFLSSIGHLFEQLDSSTFVSNNTENETNYNFINNSEYIINESSDIYKRVFNQSRNLSKMSQDYNCILGTLLCYSVHSEKLDIYLFSENLSILSQDNLQFLNEYNNSRKNCLIGVDTVKKESSRTLVFITSFCRFTYDNKIYAPHPHIVLIMNHDGVKNHISLLDLNHQFFSNQPKIIHQHNDINFPVAISQSIVRPPFNEEDQISTYAYTIFKDPLNEHQSKENFSLWVNRTGDSPEDCDITLASVNKNSTEFFMFCEHVELLNNDGELLYNFSELTLVRITVNNNSTTTMPLLEVTVGDGLQHTAISFLGFNSNIVLISLEVIYGDYFVYNLVQNFSETIELKTHETNFVLFDNVNNTVKTIPAPQTQIFNVRMYRPLDSVFLLQDGTVAMIARYDHFQNYGSHGVNVTGEIDPICSENSFFNGTSYNKAAMRLDVENMTWGDLQCSYQDVRDYEIPYPDAIVMISNSGRIIYEVNHTGNNSFSLISVPWVTAELPIDNEAQQLDNNNSTSEPTNDLNNSENDIIIDEHDTTVEGNDNQSGSNGEDFLRAENDSAENNLAENIAETSTDEVEGFTTFQFNWQFIFAGILLTTLIIATIGLSFRKKKSKKDPWH